MVAAIAAAAENSSPPSSAARAASHTRPVEQLGGDQHVGAVVLDRLEHGDRAAELLPLLGVGGGLLSALAGHTDALRGEQQPSVVDQRLAGAGDDLDGGSVQGDPGGPAPLVQVGRDLDGHAVGVELDQRHVVTDARRAPGPPVPRR